MLFSSIAKAKFEYKVFKANKFRVIANNINMQKFQKSQKNQQGYLALILCR